LFTFAVNIFLGYSGNKLVIFSTKVRGYKWMKHITATFPN